MIQLPSSKPKQAMSHYVDRGKRLRDPPPEGRAANEYVPSRIPLQLSSSPAEETSKGRWEEEGWLCFSFVPLFTSVFPVSFQNSHRCCPLLITRPCHFTGIFWFGFTCELLGKQIIYMSHPFLTAHFDDYTMFEFSLLFHVLPPTNTTVGRGKCFFFLPVNCKQNYTWKKSCQLPSCIKRADPACNCVLSYAQLHYIKRMFNMLSHQAVINAKYICMNNIFQ